MAASYGVIFRIDNQLGVPLTDGKGSYENGGAITPALPAVIAAGFASPYLTVRIATGHADVKGYLTYKASFGKDEKNIIFRFQSGQKDTPSLAHIEHDDNYLFSSKVTPYSSDDNPLQVTYIIGEPTARLV